MAVFNLWQDCENVRLPYMRKTTYLCKRPSFSNLKNENMACHFIKININKQLTNQAKTLYTSLQESRGFWDYWRLPVQFNPSPIYPGLHVHTYDPCVLLHVASLRHLLRVPSHSSISVVKLERNKVKKLYKYQLKS